MEFKKWEEVLAPYNNAVEELKVKFKNIRKEFLTKGEYSPIEFVTGRTKKISSIMAKSQRLSIENAEEDMEDIAGIRIMCQFVEDIQTIVECIRQRNDMTIVAEKDYIENFKDSGYRSYHVIIKYPINSIKGSREILCEIQIRTLAMNFWATIEHSLKYKYEHFIPENIATRLRRAADAAFILDQEMSEIREDIMRAQVMCQIKAVTTREISDKINKLHSLGEIEISRFYKNKLSEFDEDEDDELKLIKLRNEVDNVLKQYKNN
ncbi:MAG: GTP pyrophosphokinase family protein [Peptostreptococcaceae bacterium]